MLHVEWDELVYSSIENDRNELALLLNKHYFNNRKKIPTSLFTNALAINVLDENKSDKNDYSFVKTVTTLEKSSFLFATKGNILFHTDDYDDEYVWTSVMPIAARYDERELGELYILNNGYIEIRPIKLLENIIFDVSRLHAVKVPNKKQEILWLVIKDYELSKENVEKIFDEIYDKWVELCN